ncbi:MAG: COX15/CtaA family protein [Planctomycetota bacterium]|nr:COX15/CtaA family protein [Planctomycetota bacterium]
MSAVLAPSPAPWPHRLALAMVVAAIPLLLFGGSVTSLEAGMAIDGWLVLERGRGDHFLFFYPVEKWFRDVGTFVEHTHRLFGSLVGFLAIGTVVATFLGRRRRAERALAAAALAAVCAQGAVGGFRVLENSPSLAFLHGAFGQAVFALLAATAVGLSPRWGAAEAAAPRERTDLGRLALGTCGFVYSAVFLGAWLRHSETPSALAAHLVGMLVAATSVLALARGLKAGAQDEGGRPELRSARARLVALLSVQLALGVLSFLVLYVRAAPAVQELHDSLFPTLHVLFGALLLAQCVVCAMWSGRWAPSVVGGRA